MHDPRPPAIVTREHGVTSLGPVVLVIAKRPPTDEVAAVMRSTLEATRAAFPAGIGYLQIIDNNRYPTTDASRELYLSLINRHRAVIRGAVAVLKHEGFFGAAIRAVISGLLLASKAPFPVKIPATLGEGTVWLKSSP